MHHEERSFQLLARFVEIDAHGFKPQPRRDEIDGLRAIAVLPVLLYHLQLGVPAGFAGVDVFFVISGFLITSILLSELSMGAFSLQQFWLRRCRRLFPAFAVMLGAVLVGANSLLLAASYTSLATQTLASLVGGANVALYLTTDYFTAKLDEPLLHCWSLAVEEQFYLLMPLGMWGLWRGFGAKAVFCGLAAVLLGSLVASVVESASHPKLSFYLLPMRAWELALGGLLAFERTSTKAGYLSAAQSEVAAVIGLLMISTSYFAFDRRQPWPGHAALLPSSGAALFIAVERHHRTFCGALLATRLAVFVGKISYSLYLWHWPLFVLVSLYSSSGDGLDGRHTALVVRWLLMIVTYV